MRKDKLTTKGRLTIHPETTMAINNNPSRDIMSPRSTIWGRVKRSHTVDLCPSAPSAIFITMARVLKNATNVTRANPKGNGCFECGAPGHFKRDCPKLKNKDGEMGVHKARCMQLGMQRRKGMHRGTQTPMSSRIRSS
ncbi:putative reverse transcriptase domain-containing protein [Tanacetum coccineum]